MLNIGNLNYQHLVFLKLLKTSIKRSIHMLTDIEKLDEVLILFYITIFSFKEFSEHIFFLKMAVFLIIIEKVIEQRNPSILGSENRQYA